jgi:FKBP-type peptidyl-prolyl cis-trans isomerase
MSKPPTADAETAKPDAVKGGTLPLGPIDEFPPPPPPFEDTQFVEPVAAAFEPQPKTKRKRKKRVEPDEAPEDAPTASSALDAEAPAFVPRAAAKKRSAWPAYAVLFTLVGVGFIGMITGASCGASDTKDAPSTSSATRATAPTETAAAPTASPDDDKDLGITDVVVGSGAAVAKGDTVRVHYVGTLANGKEFDASRKRGDEGFKFEVGQGRVIKGWDQGLVGMKVGGKRKLWIPPRLGYGARAMGTAIPPNSTLVFEIELLEIVAPKR